MSATTPGERLRWLAAAWGIDAQFDDIWGRRHCVSDDALRALLAEFGLDTGSDAAVERELARTHPGYWRRLAEPVVAVAAPAQAFEVPLRVARRAPGERVAWRLAREAGAPAQGEAGLDALDCGERAEVEGVAHESRTLRIEAALEPGYHRLELRAGDASASVLVVAAPQQCYRPPPMRDDARVWGWSVQLYGLRSERNWGIGDFGDLVALIDVAATRGANAIGLNPLHARFAHEPSAASPYAPSSRLWLDALSIEVEAVEDFAEADAVRARVRARPFRERLDALRASTLVDHAGVSAAKHEVLRELHAHFRATHLARDSARAAQFRAFQARGGAALRAHATFEARAETGVEGAGEGEGEQQALAPERIEYHEYLQWLADLQLARASERCREHGMAIGLYLDLAVSVDRAGSDCRWFDGCFAASASVGAPPDEFNLSGQDWGLPPLLPHTLRERGHEPFVLTLRAAMRHAGALRIDHVMGLMRLYWVPRGAGARDGAYVRYPFDELLAIVSLESHRNRCMVIGEDLGTVPDVVRDRLGRARVLSYRLLYFQRDAAGGFLPPPAWPREALVSIGTHDLPTLAGWWTGHDLRVRAGLGLFPDEGERERRTRERERDRARLVAALARDGFLPADAGAGAEAGVVIDDGSVAGIDAIARGPLDAALVEAIHAWLASSPARLMMLQPEDWLGVLEQANVPGTVDEHPNWRRKLPLTIDGLAGDVRAARVTAAVARHREGLRRAPDEQA